MQRNLGANAGLDYRELTEFLTAIIDREQSALSALLVGAPAELSTPASCTCCSPSAAACRKTVPAASSGRPAVELGAGGGCTCRNCKATGGEDIHLPQSHTVANGCVQAVRQGCCLSAACAGDGRKRCPELWQREDCAAVIMCAVEDERRRAKILQTAFNLRRATSALAELRTGRMCD